MIELLTASGEALRFIEAITINRSIDQLISTCELSFSLNSVQGVDLSGISKIRYRGKTIFTGMFNKAKLKMQTGQRFAYSFVSKPFYLANSMHLGKKTFNNSMLSTILNEMVTPFGVKIASLAVDPKITNFSVNSTETVFEAIDRLVKENGLLIIDNFDGDLEVINARESNTDINLQVGENLEVLDIESDLSNIHSEVIYITESKEAGSLRASAKDLNALGYSPIIKKANSRADTKTLQSLANYDVAMADARKTKITASLPVTNWHVNNRVLKVNESVSLEYPDYPVFSGLYMIKDITMAYGKSDGHSLELSLTSSESFIAKPEIPKQKQASGGFLEVNFD